MVGKSMKKKRRWVGVGRDDKAEAKKEQKMWEKSETPN